MGTWCGHEVAIMSVLCNIKEAMQLDCSKDMSVHVYFSPVTISMH